MKDFNIFKEALAQLKIIELNRKRVCYTAILFLILSFCIIGLENSSQYFNILIIPLLTIILCYVLSNKIYYVFIFIFFIYSLKNMISIQLDSRVIINPFIASLAVLMGIICFCFFQLVINKRTLPLNEKLVYLFVSFLSLLSCVACFNYLYGDFFIRSNVEFLLDNYIEEKYPNIKDYKYSIDYNSYQQLYEVKINDKINKDNDFMITYNNGNLNDDYIERMVNKTNIINRTYEYLMSFDIKTELEKYLQGTISSMSLNIVISDEDKSKLYSGMPSELVLKIIKVDVILELNSNADLHDKLINDKIKKVFAEYGIKINKLILS